MNVVLVHPTPRPFIELDVRLLRSAFSVKAFSIRFSPRRKLVSDHLRVLSALPKADILISWFGGPHALLPFLAARLLRIPRLVIASGVDVADLPSIGYGHMRGGWLQYAGQAVFAMADRVIAVSQHTARETARNARVPPSKIEVVYHGLPRVDRLPDHARSGVVTVASPRTETTIQRKGLHTFIRAAARCPDTDFKIVGGGRDDVLRVLRHNAPPNVAFTGWLSQKMLAKRMRHARIYAQLSAYESFGMALAEAMNHGCIPIVTNRGALPEVVGPTGWYVPYGDPDATARAIRDALAAPDEAGQRAHDRIRSHFPLSIRREQLVAHVRAVATSY